MRENCLKEQSSGIVQGKMSENKIVKRVNILRRGWELSMELFGGLSIVNVLWECPAPDAELQVSTCSDYNLCHPG